MSPTSRCPAAAGGEVPADQVRAGHRPLAGQRRALAGPRLAGPQAELAHQVSDQPHRDSCPSRLSYALTRRQP